VVDSTEAIEQLLSFGLPELPDPRRHVYLNFGGQIYFDVTNTAGLSDDRSCSTSAAADFDNDMDLDLYLVCHDRAGNLPNQLMENDGNGVFSLVPDAAGALGTNLGVGDALALADFDSDGFIDILVTNGAGVEPLVTDGPTELFKNSGNGNNWLAINLHGTQSNSQGIGASVIVTANGISQYRFQDGGMHRFAQNHARLHFGLADNTEVETIEVRWPSGTIQVLETIVANQFLDITEPSDGDADFDTIDDAIDNCLGVANLDQRDTDGDGFGNYCDPDHNNDCIINFLDVQIMAADFLQTGSSLDTDINGDQVVNFVDAFAVFNGFLSEPGPSAMASCPLAVQADSL